MAVQLYATPPRLAVLMAVGARGVRGGDRARVARGEKSPGLPISPEAHQTRQRGSARAQSQLTSVHADADRCPL